MKIYFGYFKIRINAINLRKQFFSNVFNNSTKTKGKIADSFFHNFSFRI